MAIDKNTDNQTPTDSGVEMATGAPSTTVLGSALRALLRPWQRIVIATLVVAGGDAAFAFAAYVLVAHRLNFETLLQFIASGLVGDAAYASGWVGLGYAMLGFAIHFGLSAGFVIVYALAIAPMVRTPITAIAVGLTYGAGVWLFMNALVLPLGRSAREPFLSSYYIAFLIEHALLVGLPIALIMLGAYATTSRSR